MPVAERQRQNRNLLRRPMAGAAVTLLTNHRWHRPAGGAYQIQHGNRITQGSTDPGWRVARAQQSLRPAAQEPRMLRLFPAWRVSRRGPSCPRPLCGLARPSSANAQYCTALALRRGKRPIHGRGSPPNRAVMATELANHRRNEKGRPSGEAGAARQTGSALSAARGS
jgi:hypothetical protein